ncbi:MAG: hypothetical protein AAF991_11850 [Pseudomonadota bacterium]
MPATLAGCVINKGTPRMLGHGSFRQQLRFCLLGFMLGGTIVIGGCAETPSTGGSQASSAPSVFAKRVKASPGLSPRQRIRRALELLEVGDEATARAELEAYQKAVPSSQVARDLLAQIDQSAAEYFPSDFQEVFLKSGQSLSNVAQTYLGSAYKFYALAKYNDIRQPRRVVPGQIIKVPLTDTAMEAFDKEGVSNEESIVDSRSVAEQLESDESLKEELESVADVPLDEQPEETPIAPAVAESIEENDPVPTLPVEEAAAALTMQAKQVQAMHREAISAYRAQDLDRAIELWDEVLELDPEHEGAQIYREQAMTLKSRLESLN